uniref:Uncharacterized protein n=1 Tax=Avena sativa TaxID=4498 RepID=A0ACD5UFX5_AVESA
MASNSTSVVVNHDQRVPETSSICFTESYTAAHNFKLMNYPMLDGMGVGKSIRSSEFSVGGYNWTITFYPDGVDEAKCAGNASAYLRCVSQLKENVRTKFTLNMLEIDGKVQVTNFAALNYVFSAAKIDLGYNKFVEKSKLKPSASIRSGYLIRCVLTVIKEPRTEVNRNLLKVPQPDLQEHLRQMWKDGQGADLTFSVGGQMFNAHRYLLAARSPVFKAELFGPMKEKAAQSIEIDDIEPSIFEALLHFVYTDSLPDDEHYKFEGSMANFQHLLVAADRYGLERLRLLCESKLCEGIDVETVATTLVLAEQHHCKDLKEACVEFMAPRNVLQAVMATDGFKHLVETCPLVMKEILDMVSSSG